MRAIRSRPYIIALLLVGLLGACSTDTPTAPGTTGAPEPGSVGGPTTWNVTVTVSPRKIEQSSELPVTVTVTVRRADNNQAPPDGATVIVSGTLGEFVAAGSTLQSVAAELFSGVTQVAYFPGSLPGTAVIQAQIEKSFGQATVTIEESLVEVVANFDTVNPEGNRSVQFLNTSTGDPTRFRWDFGDGTTSRERNPFHVFPSGGVFFVQLTASKPGSSDTVGKNVTVTEEEEVDAPNAAFSFLKNPPDFDVFFFNESTGCESQPARAAVTCSYLWLFGDGDTSTAKDPTHDYGGAGTWTVTLRVENAGGSSTTSKDVTLP